MTRMNILVISFQPFEENLEHYRKKRSCTWVVEFKYHMQVGVSN